MRDIRHTAHVIDVRDIIARYEELEETADILRDAIEDAEEDGRTEDLAEAKAAAAAWEATDDGAEYVLLGALLEDLAGNGGDEQWRGDWYPVTLIRDSYFTTYAQELADDIGAIDSNASWPLNCIDWEQAARELRMDYSSVEYGGVTYWYR